MIKEKINFLKKLLNYFYPHYIQKFIVCKNDNSKRNKIDKNEYADVVAYDIGAFFSPLNAATYSGSFN